jgi:hypothetical protein
MPELFENRDYCRSPEGSVLSVTFGQITSVA